MVKKNQINNMQKEKPQRNQIHANKVCLIPQKLEHLLTSLLNHQDFNTFHSTVLKEKEIVSYCLCT